MNVELSPETEERLLRLVERGDYESIESAISAVVADAAEYDSEYEAELSEKLNRAREMVRQGKHQLLTVELADEIKRDGRAQLAARQLSPRD